jgi:hypothetical protein
VALRNNRWILLKFGHSVQNIHTVYTFQWGSLPPFHDADTFEDVPTFMPGAGLDGIEGKPEDLLGLHGADRAESL